MPSSESRLPGTVAGDEHSRRQPGTGFASSLMGSAVKAAKGALGGPLLSARRETPPLGEAATPYLTHSISPVRGTRGKSAATLEEMLRLNDRLLEDNTALQSEVCMWQGKYDALERTCRDMEREITRQKESMASLLQKKESMAALLHADGRRGSREEPQLPHRGCFTSPRLSASQSLILTLDPMLADKGIAGPASHQTASVGPHLARQGSIWVPPSPNDELARLRRGSRSPDEERERSISPLEPCSSVRPPLLVGGGSGGEGANGDKGREAAAVKLGATTEGEAEGELRWGQASESEEEDEAESSDEESEHWLEYVVHLGVSARTAYMIWQDASDTQVSNL